MPSCAPSRPEITVFLQGPSGNSSNRMQLCICTLPVYRLVIAWYLSLLKPARKLHDEYTRSPQHPIHLREHALQVEGMIESVRVNGVDGCVGKDGVVKISAKNVAIDRSRIEVDADGKVSQ